MLRSSTRSGPARPGPRSRSRQARTSGPPAAEGSRAPRRTPGPRAALRAGVPRLRPARSAAGPSRPCAGERWSRRSPRAVPGTRRAARRSCLGPLRAHRLAFRGRWTARVTIDCRVVIHDQPGAALPRHVGPDPLEKDTYPKAGLSHEFEVHGCPRQPRDKAAHVHLSALQDGEPLPDDGHVALVEVVEGTGSGLSSYPSVNEPPRIASLLHRHLGHARQRMTILVERGRVTDDEDLRVARHGEILPHADPPGVIRLHLQPLADR